MVYVDGAFDLFHLGHIEFLKRAKSHGDFLIVGVHDDQTINAIRGANYPVMNLHERLLSVLACRVSRINFINIYSKISTLTKSSLGHHIQLTRMCWKRFAKSA